MIETTVPGEQTIALAIANLAALAEALGDGRPQRIVLDARQQLSRHLDAEKWNAWTARVRRESRRRGIKARHQGRREARHGA